MATVRFVKAAEAKINDAPITDGTIYVSSDTDKMFVDNGDERSRIGIKYSISKSENTIKLDGDDGSSSSIVDKDTWIALKGATSSENGIAGYVPAPNAGAANRYLRSDGTWAVPPDTNTTYTLSSFGISATADEINKLDGCTITTTELNYLSGLSGNIQNQLNDKASNNHTHNYLPLSGGTLTGTLTGTSIFPSINNTYDIGSSSLKYKNIYANSFVGSLSGKASSADMLATSRTISLSGAVSGSAAFDGKNDITINTSFINKAGIGPVAISANQPTDKEVILWVQP